MSNTDFANISQPIVGYILAITTATPITPWITAIQIVRLKYHFLLIILDYFKGSPVVPINGRRMVIR